MPKVEENLVPETCVEKMQDSMLNATDVEVNSTRRVNAITVCALHPIALDACVYQCVNVLWIEITQVVPTRSGPLRHCVDLAAVALRSAAEPSPSRARKIELNLKPITGAR